MFNEAAFFAIFVFYCSAVVAFYRFNVSLMLTLNGYFIYLLFTTTVQCKRGEEEPR